MAFTKLNKDGTISESTVQIVVMRWVNLQPDLSPYVIHIPNESKRSPAYGAKLKAMGMRKGVSDLFIALARGKYHGAWIEIKTDKGKPTVTQLEFLEDMRRQGYYGVITHGIDETIDQIREYQNLV